MAISINWATRVINVPKLDMTLVQSTPIEVRELNLNTFRLVLKDLEDSEDGMSFPTTHNHVAPFNVGGVTLARVIEIINDYTVTFEDGTYVVNLIGANSNVIDRVNPNNVSVRSSNSAGLVQSNEIEHSSFQNKVTIDVINGSAGTIYPIGTPFSPVNNIEDAKLIATYRGFKVIELLSDLTIITGQSIDELQFISRNWLVITIDIGASCINTFFNKLSIYGEMSGVWNVMDDCWLYTITNFCGWLRNCSFVDVILAPYSLASGGNSFFDNCLPMQPGDISVLTMNTNTHVSFTNAFDLYRIQGMTVGSTLSIGLAEGMLTIDSSCVGGVIIVGGIGELVNNSALVVDSFQLLNEQQVRDAMAIATVQTPVAGSIDSKIAVAIALSS